jgi:hypothetical protein
MRFTVRVARINLLLFSFLLLAVEPVYSENLEAKLTQQANYIPAAGTTLTELLDVAQHYGIPMGIEWVYQPTMEELRPIVPNKATVEDLIKSILQQSLGYQMETAKGVLHIYQPFLYTDPKNFLNIRVPTFEVKDATVFGIEAKLRRDIPKVLHPEPHESGSSGGRIIGGHRSDGFDLNNITFSGKNICIREVLDNTIVQNGNSLWVAQLDVSQMMSNEPFYAQVSLYKKRAAATTFEWQLIGFKMTKEGR